MGREWRGGEGGGAEDKKSETVYSTSLNRLGLNTQFFVTLFVSLGHNRTTTLTHLIFNFLVGS